MHSNFTQFNIGTGTAIVNGQKMSKQTALFEWKYMGNLRPRSYTSSYKGQEQSKKRTDFWAFQSSKSIWDVH